VCAAAEVRVRPLADQDLDEADRIFRVAFGTFLGAPDPEGFFGDADYVRTRWRAQSRRRACRGARWPPGRLELRHQLGQRRILRPVDHRAALLGPGHRAQRLLDSTMELFTAWKTRHIGLFTFRAERQARGLVSEIRVSGRVFLTAVMSQSRAAGCCPLRIDQDDRDRR